MAIQFTPHQQEAVNVVGGNILVSAAAGSGKTAVLTERVVKLLTGENPISADRIIVVTFTVAAADEMRRRISGRLTELMEENPSDEWLQSQYLLLPRAKISTIHSLCSALIKENLQKLGLSGDLRIAEESELAVLKQDAVNEIMEKFYQEKNPRFLELVEFTCTRNDRPLSELILSVYDFIRSFAFPLDFLDQTQQMYDHALGLDDNPWVDEVSRHVRTGLSQCLSILKGCIGEIEQDEQVAEKYLESFLSDYNQILSVLRLVESGKFSEACEKSRQLERLPLKGVRKYGAPEFLDSLKGRRQKVYDIAGGILKRFLSFSDADFLEDTAKLSPMISMLFDCVRSVYERIEEKKRENDQLDYADLEHFALRLLVEKTPDGYRKTKTAGELSELYEQIMVDECQDINEVQNLIFQLLSRNETNLYMVGDVKQSIYRFRKAMPKLFIEKKKAFHPFDPHSHQDTSEETIVLESNFRSRKEVCDVVNYLFTQIMSSEMGEIEYGEGEALDAGASYDKYEDSCPEVHILDYSRDSDEEKSAAEARYIGNLIRSMVEGGYQVQDKKGMRTCSYRDFAILLRSFQGKAPTYAGELKALGVPCFSSTSEGYFDAYEVAVILNLLRIVDNPLLDVPLLSVLLSPLGGFTPDQTAEIRLARKNVPFYLALRELAGSGNSACSSFVEFLSGLRRKAAILTTDALIQEIYDQTDFPALAYAMGGGEQKDANLRLMLTYAEKYEQIGTGGLSGFLRYVDRMIEGGQDFSCANTSSSHADCVQIMSIHASKGLEFPVCIVADCGKKFNKSDLNSRVQMNSELGFSMKISDPDTLRSYTSFPFEAIRLKSEKETISEEMRVLYVAMTRAKEKLILVMTIPGAENRLKGIADSIGEDSRISPFEVFSAQGYDGWILSAMLRHPDFYPIRKRIERTELPLLPADFHVRGIYVPLSGEREQAAEPVREFLAKPSGEVTEKLMDALHYQYPYQPLTEVPAKLTVTQIAKQARGEKVTLEARPAFLQQQGLSPAQRGTILHSFMQFADFELAERDLTMEIERLKQKKFLTAEEAAVLNRPKIEAFLRSPLYRRMKSAEELLREYKFLYFIPAGEVDDTLPKPFSEEKILIQGIADCLMFEKEGITIIDYKTDYSNQEQVLAQRYFDQLRIYKAAIEQAFSKPVRQCLLYSLHLEKEIEILC